MCTYPNHTISITLQYLTHTTILLLLHVPSCFFAFLQAVYEEIQNHKPDVVRQTVRENYRYDENVLPSKPLPERKIIVPTSGAAEVIYANGAYLYLLSCIILGSSEALNISCCNSIFIQPIPNMHRSMWKTVLPT